MNQINLVSLLQSNFRTIRVAFEPSVSDIDWDNRGPAPIAYPSNSLSGAPKAQPRQVPGTPVVQKAYTYKCPMDVKIAVNDTVVVYVENRGLCLAYVVEVHEFADIDLNADYQYKWIVQVVDMTGYNDRVEKEAKFSRLVVEAERVKQREVIMESFRQNLPAEGEARKLFDEAMGLFTPQINKGE